MLTDEVMIHYTFPIQLHYIPIILINNTYIRHFLMKIYKYNNICTKRFIYIEIPELICLHSKVDKIAE